MRYSKLIILFLAVTLTFAPTSFAWNWDTHSSIVEQVYYSMPSSVQSKLSLAAMNDGSMIQIKFSMISEIIVILLVTTKPFII